MSSNKRRVKSFPENLCKAIMDTPICKCEVLPEMVSAAAGCLQGRNKLIVDLYFKEQKTLTEIAQQIGLSVERIRQLKNRTVFALARAIDPAPTTKGPRDTAFVSDGVVIPHNEMPFERVLELSAFEVAALKSHGYQTVGDLGCASFNALVGIPGFGCGHARNIQKAFDAYVNQFGEKRE